MNRPQLVYELAKYMSPKEYEFVLFYKDDTLRIMLATYQILTKVK